MLRDQLESGSIDCEIQPEKGMHLFENLSTIAITLEPSIGPIQVGFSAKCTSPDEDFNYIEN